ncbi:uncharacterized protein BDR25DRAFT_210544 [Lindgomyces ingoldianus]|uniref:Uncharacterized protein n=1 Tax=Lindgomyces ingoldianus TaxID=673940 RepID=A0ACB6RAQ9_9PLEO|nr:uncharacterized protein BDR25DRAFT_210544 [Lindgomyces ingoldianus]KAF2476389.1 hypothetical protein BDR25DRAFT_210544 [Lindgomyces ingoldianus]
MSEYSKMKNADLEALLKTRGLPTGGKKADMVDRLTKDDESKKAAEAKAGKEAPATSAKVAVLHPEDEIDWDDDASDTAAESAKPVKPTIAPAEAVIKASGEDQVPNPQAVPSQKADIDPSKTSDLSVKLPTEEQKDGSAAPEEKEKAPVDYSKGLAASTIDDEIEKRKARAKRFGINTENDESLKKLERQKKGGDFGPPKGLDDSLPERTRKRGRDDNDEDGRNKRRGGGRLTARRGRGNRDGGNRDGDRRRDNRNEDRGKPSIDGANWMRDEDRAKMEARKKRFAAAST